MPGIPYQSKLGPYEEWIMELRAMRPPTPFRQIALLLKAAHGFSVSHSVISDFVKVRTKWNKHSRRGAPPLEKALSSAEDEPDAAAPASHLTKPVHARTQAGENSHTAQRIAAARARIQARQNASKKQSDPRWDELARISQGPLTLAPKRIDPSN